ncbi:non-symbiotic hemoglobin 1-like [Haliotis rubra]|uniref:non-symbiotic hemoglobin 1-like n=1 Tax=Haliotis rubra TaxID=36100 RepID=UPI001EE56728|nr:non-symbiotic hemoglobin 1-like [Haliotis rubra]
MGLHHSKKSRNKRASSADGKGKGKGKKYLPTNGHTCNGHIVAPARDPLEHAPKITEPQKAMVLESWQIIQEDISKVGVVMFMKLFETHPDVQDVFYPFKGQSSEDLKYSSQLKSHALRVMGTVEKCLARINDPKKLVELLHDLGARHVMYNARVDYIDLIGPQFIWAIQPVVGDKWNPELEQAWSDVFKFISHIMKEAMTF